MFSIGRLPSISIHGYRWYFFFFYDNSHRPIQLQFLRSSLRKIKENCRMFLGLSPLKRISHLKMYSSIYRGWWAQMLNVSINTFSLYTNFSQTDRVANFMREVVAFLSSAFRISGHIFLMMTKNLHISFIFVILKGKSHHSQSL